MCRTRYHFIFFGFATVLLDNRKSVPHQPCNFVTPCQRCALAFEDAQQKGRSPTAARLAIHDLKRFPEQDSLFGVSGA